LSRWALGIGINAALFSVVNGVLLESSAVSCSLTKLVTFDQSKPNFESGAIPYLNFLDPAQREPDLLGDDDPAISVV
jgi:hypothetical protein